MFKQKSFLQALYNVPMCTTIERHIHWQHTFQTACHIWQISQPKLMVNWLPNFYPSKKWLAIMTAIFSETKMLVKILGYLNGIGKMRFCKLY